MCTPGVLLTPSNVMRVVREVKKWWGAVGLVGWLFVPVSKQKEIRQKFQGVMEQKQQSISYWINNDPLASWRRLIIALGYVREYQLAESIQHNAEPLTGISYISIVFCTCLDCALQMVLMRVF